MFALDIQSPDGTTRRFVTTARTISIGSAATCDVTLPGTSALHVRIVLDQHGYTIEDLAHTELEVELELDHREVTPWRSAREPVKIKLAGYTITCIDLQPPFFEASYGPIAREEAALVDGIVTGDTASRVVYADWLEERGEVGRAAIVRELVAGGRPDLEMLERLVPTNVRWRARVLEPAIEACPRGAACVGHWGKLEGCRRADLRRCGACTKLVLYCVDVPQARAHVAAGGTVVFDPFVLRWPDDLSPQ
jgi:uncharacterized protein (TIGR02996 family)